MMSLRLELNRGTALQATTLKAFVRGPGVTGFPRWGTPSLVQGTSLVQGKVNHTSYQRDRLRPEIHDSAGSFRPDVRGIHRYMRDSEVYDEIVTTLSFALPPGVALWRSSGG